MIASDPVFSAQKREKFQDGKLEIINQLLQNQSIFLTQLDKYFYFETLKLPEK